jgi:hypothetical protein
MNTTTLIIDEKVTIWRRSEVIVNVVELEKATAENKLKEFIALCSWDYCDSELLTETEESLLPIENDNQATIEVYNDSTLNEIIYSNKL